MLARVVDAFARGADVERVEYPRGAVIEVTEAELAEEQARRFPRLERFEGTQGQDWEEEVDPSVPSPDLIDATADAMLAQMAGQRIREEIGRDLIGVRASVRLDSGREVDMSVGDVVRELFGFAGDEF